MRKRTAWLVIIILFLLVFVIPYAKVEILSINAERKLESFDLSCLDDVYCDGTPVVYDCKIYSYSKEEYANVLYVFGDCEFGVMVDLKWNHFKQCREIKNCQTVWTIYGGSAQEFYWPLYYWDKVFPLVS